MRGKRSKQYRKAMHAYALTFNFREPYQVLVDAEIIKDAARFKMKLGGMLENTVHGSIKPMITQCCIRHLYNTEVEPGQKAEKENWIEVAKQAERRKCGHHELEEPLSALECIKSVVDPKGSGTNKHRYVVATQEREVREAMREIAGVPLIYINRSVMILEPLASKTEQVRAAEEVGKRRAGLRGRPSLAAAEKRKRDDDDDEQTTGQPLAKRSKAKGPKGPNPLSVKKAKKQPATDVPHNDPATARRTNDEMTVPHPDGSAKINADVGEEVASKTKRKRKRKPSTQDQNSNAFEQDNVSD